MDMHNEKFAGPPSNYSVMMWTRQEYTPAPWKFSPEMKTVPENDLSVPAEFSNPAKYPLPHEEFLWMQVKGSRISRNRHPRSIIKGLEPVGAVAFWPRRGSAVALQDLNLGKGSQYDTIYLQGIHPEVPTFRILEALSMYGPIEAAARKQSDSGDRRYMWVQYREWNSAWDAVVNLHGIHLIDQYIDVWFSDRSIDIKRKDSRHGDEVWDML